METHILRRDLLKAAPAAAALLACAAQASLIRVQPFELSKESGCSTAHGGDRPTAIASYLNLVDDD